MEVNLEQKNVEQIKKIEMGLSYDEVRMLEMTRQVINMGPNILNEQKNVKDLLKFYRITLSKNSSDRFQKSLISSVEVLDDPKNLLGKVLNIEPCKADSFVLIPLYSNDHAVSAVIRNMGDDYSVTVVNKAFYNNRDYAYDEYTVEKGKIEELLMELKKNSKRISTYEMYDIIKKLSMAKTELNVKSFKQKTNNCFIKETEQGIQFAYATRNYTAKDFEGLRNKDKEVRLKWEKSTWQTHCDFVELVTRKYPKLYEVLKKEFEMYLINKKIRTSFIDIKQRNGSIDEFEKALLDIVYSKTNVNGWQKRDVLLAGLSYIDCNTLKLFYKPVEAVIERNLNAKELSVCKNLKDCLHHFDISYYFEYEQNYKKLDETMNNAEKLFPWVVKHLNYDWHVGYFNNGAAEHFYGNYKESADKYEKSIRFFSNNPSPYLYKGRCLYTLGVMKKSNGMKEEGFQYFNEALKYYSKAIRLNPKYIDAYRSRAQCYETLEKNDLAQKDLEKIKHLELERLNKYDLRSRDKQIIKEFKKISNIRANNILTY